MENPNTDSNNEIALSPDEEQRMLDELETSIKRHERIVRDFNIIGPQMAGNVDEGFSYSGPSENVSA